MREPIKIGEEPITAFIGGSGNASVWDAVDAAGKHCRRVWLNGDFVDYCGTDAECANLAKEMAGDDVKPDTLDDEGDTPSSSFMRR